MEKMRTKEEILKEIEIPKDNASAIKRCRLEVEIDIRDLLKSILDISFKLDIKDPDLTATKND